jgi:methyl-accepting chemotaxis protein
MPSQHRSITRGANLDLLDQPGDRGRRLLRLLGAFLQIGSSVGEVTGRIEEIAGAAATVAASAERLQQEIAASAQTLAATAAELERLVGRFRVEA